MGRRGERRASQFDQAAPFPLKRLGNGEKRFGNAPVRPEPLSQIMRMFFLRRLNKPLVLQRLLRRRAVVRIRLNEGTNEGFGFGGDVLPVAVVAARVNSIED
jgi:hypothetical protein